MSSTSTSAPPASVTVRPFGHTPEGEAIELYTLTNRTGAQVSIASYGGTVIDLCVPDRDGRCVDVSLGFETIAPYFTKSPYFGAIIGRFGNRLAGGRFTLDGQVHQLGRNNGPNALHGGLKGFDKQLWTAKIAGQSPASLKLSRTSPDGEEDYPGTLEVAVTYTFTDAAELRIDYWAQTDRPTILNLTNHTYFNLAGAGQGNILDHELKIDADFYTPVNEALIPTGEIREVAGTPMDFREWTTIGSRLAAVGGSPVGYDHNYVLNRPVFGGLGLAAEVWEPGSGRLMTVHTDQPGIQFYSGNFLDGSFAGKGGKVYRQHDAFCLETQHFPDAPNQPNFPSTVLRPGETFESTTIYTFSTR